MANNKIGTLVDELTGLTERNRVKWKNTPKQDCFMAVLQRGGVEIRRRSDFDADDREFDWYELTLFNPDGHVIEVATTNSTASSWDAVSVDIAPTSNLYRLARSDALQGDDVIDELIGELHDISHQ